MKKKNIFLWIASILLATFIALNTFLVYQLFSLDILDTIYEILIAAILVILALILAILLFHPKKGFKITALILILIFGSVIGYGDFVIAKANGALSSITDVNAIKIRYDLIEYDDSPKESNGLLSMFDKLPDFDMTTLADKTFGIVEVGDTTFNKDVVSAIRNDVGNDVKVNAIRSLNDAYSMLVNGDIDVLVLNENVKPMFEEDINAVSKVFKIYEFEKETVDIRKEAKVTSEPFVVYISGIDVYGPLSYQSRTDVNKLMVVNPIKNKILLIDIPRDYYIPLTCLNDQKDKLTHSGIHGVECSVNSLGNFFGIDINYYARVNFTSLIEIVDALGGINVFSDYAFTSSGYSFAYGDNYLTGDEALAFSRERYSFADGDNQRIKNQSKVLAAIIDKATSPAIISGYADLMNVMGNTVETNLTNDEILDLVKMQLKNGGAWQIDSFAVNGYGTSAYSPDCGMNLYMMEPNIDSVNEALAKINELMNDIY